MTEAERLERIELAIAALADALWGTSPAVRSSEVLVSFTNEERERRRARDAVLLSEQRAREADKLARRQAAAR